MIRPTVFFALLSVGCNLTSTQDCAVEDEILVFFDEDGDGFGRVTAGYVCSVGANQSTNNLDCNDAFAEVFPGAAEICDDLDNNCDGQVDEGFETLLYFIDEDNDGFGGNREFLTCEDPGEGWVTEPGDCNDQNENVFPLQEEICGNGLDDNCDGSIDFGPETCDNGVDDNCDGTIDCDDDLCIGAPGCQLVCVDETLTNFLPAMVNGTTVGQGDDWFPQCGASNATDYSFQFTAPLDGLYTFDTVGSGYDTVIAAFDGCGGIQLDCNDDTFGLQSQITLSLTAGEIAVIVVDGFSSNSGDFVLNATGP
ncbi:MAG: putative metal-binding motif-containing protein [Myxococcota bacterium]